MYYMVYVLRNLKHFFLAALNILFEAWAMLNVICIIKNGINFRVKLSVLAITTTELYQTLWIVHLPTKIWI